MTTENDHLLDIAAETRRVLADPEGIYAKNPAPKRVSN
jgi:hypothetical protein